LPNLGGVVPSTGRLPRTPRTSPSGCPIPVLDGKPFSVAFAVGIGGIPVVEQVTQFMDQDVVQIEVADRIFRPRKGPGVPGLLPLASVHTRFVVKSGLGGGVEVLDQ